MNFTLNKILRKVIKRFDLAALLLYVLVMMAAVAHFSFSQDRIAKQMTTLDESTLIQASRNNSLILDEQVTSIHFVNRNEKISNNPIIFDKTTFGLKRTINLENIQISFIHPVWLLFNSWLFLGVTFIFGAIVVYARIAIMKTIDKQIAPMKAIEAWAYRSKVHADTLPLDTTNLVAETITSLLKEVNEAKQLQGKMDLVIREQALLDSETGIGNREFFSNRLDAFLKEEDAFGSVFLIQCKEGENIQAIYGYQQAVDILDICIESIKKILKPEAYYFIARQSEFDIALLVPDLYPVDSEKLADKLLKSLLKISLPDGIEQEEFIHIGIANFDLKTVKNTQKQLQSYKIMAEVDMALRSAQLQGPAQWFRYADGEVSQEAAKGSLRWRTFLSKAIQQNAFVIFFQPVISHDNETILHHEVLAKVRESTGKLINARIFLPMAQKCGLDKKIDMLVFEQVCRILQYENKPQDMCSLNLSIDALLNEAFITEFIDKLQLYPQIAKQLIIEVSEYYLASNTEELLPAIQQLHAAGLKILADKVGQYIVPSDYLAIFPIDSVKLHRSIVSNIHEKIENQVFIQSLKNRCEQHNIKIYALGVENKTEWKRLVKLGVVGGQGHFFTEPVAQMANAISPGR